MARLPSDAELGALGSANSGRGVATFDTSGYARGAAALAKGVDDIGKGLTSAGRDIAAVAKQQQTETDTLNEAKADSTYLVRTKQLRDELSTETDPDKLDERYKPQFEAARDTAANLISDPRKRELWLLKRNPDVEGHVIATTDKQFALNREKSVADVQGQLDTLRQTGLKSADPAQRVEVIDTGNKLITGLQTAGYIDAQQAQKLRKSWVENYAISAVDMLPADQQVNVLRESPQGKDAVLDRIGGVENSTGNPAARNPSSTAMGNFQFINKTWLDVVGRHRPDLVQGRSEADILALRADPKLSREMAGYLLDENADALRGQGIAPDAGSLYLAHFLGAGGAAKVLKSAPGTPVADVLDKDAINANRSVLAGKTTDSVIAWANAKMGGSARGQGGLIDFIPEDKRVAMLMRAQTTVLRDQQQSDSNTALEQYTVSSKINDDIGSMANTGTGIDDITYDRVRNSLGTKKAQEWQDAREDAHSVYVGSHDFSTLSADQINARLQSLYPKAGANYARQQTVYDEVKKRADVVMKQRAEDPAAAVSDDPNVQAARKGMGNDVPEDQRGSPAALYAARIAAQQRAGIPEDAQSPITKQEALALTAPLRRMLPGQEREVLTDLAQTFQQQFGEQADKAFEYALRANRMDRETAAVAARVMRKLALGDVPDAAEVRQADHTQEIAAADRAVGGSTILQPSSSDGFNVDPMVNTPAPTPTPEGVNIPARAVTALRADPRLASEFDAKYGKGLAKQILDKYPVVTR